MELANRITSRFSQDTRRGGYWNWGIALDILQQRAIDAQGGGVRPEDMTYWAAVSLMGNL
jgi:hypothetical protein